MQKLTLPEKESLPLRWKILWTGFLLGTIVVASDQFKTQNNLWFETKASPSKVNRRVATSKSNPFSMPVEAFNQRP
jgi:hypothetical protein